MILQELVRLYNRLDENNETEIWELGFSPESIHYAIIISQQGQFIKLEDLRFKGEDGKPHPSVFVAPKFEGKRAGAALKPYFLWDNSQYVLGIELKNKKTKKKPKHFEAFLKLQKEIISKTDLKNTDVNAVISFLESDSEKNKLVNSTAWQLAIEENLTGVNLSFINDDSNQRRFVFEKESVKQAWRAYYQILDAKAPKKMCLVTGEVGPVFDLQPTIKKGVGGGGKNDIPLISFNENVFESYQFKGNQNAQINRFSAGKFSHAINYLRMVKKHNLRIVDTLTLFWAEKNKVVEDLFGGLFDNKLAEEDGYSKVLETFLKEIRVGRLPLELEDESRFFVLGLAPNSARISVRFWHTDTVRDIGKKIAKHFNDLQIIPQNKDKNRQMPSIWQLLIETVPLREGEKRKSENIPPNIIGPVMRSILMGIKYPKNLLTILVSRIRIDKRINYYRASFLKAILNRNFNKELKVALDTQRTTVPYCLGRLFAVLEKTQEDALDGNVNATIKDRYFASASAAPRVVFPLIIKLAQNHLKKLKNKIPGAAINKEKLIGEIMNLLTEFPANLKLDEQGEFAIGYYHQRQYFFTSKPEETEGEN